MNVSEIEMQLGELGGSDFDPVEFPFQFIECLDPPKATVTKLRQGTMNKSKAEGEVLWSKKLYFRIADDGDTAGTLDAMAADALVAKHAPRFLLTTDGREFSVLDTKLDETRHGAFTNLNDDFDFFLPLAGIERYEAVAENKADVKAAGRLARFYDAILAANPDWTEPEHTHALNQFMARVLFCMFAEDTGIIERNLFTRSLTDYINIGGTDVAPLLRAVFDMMDTAPDARTNDTPDYIKRFPYVNGGLFEGKTEVPTFSKLARRILLESARQDWKEINPDIFGSMIQAVVEPGMRGDLGMHYTSVPNIMKVLQPLFLMDLEEEFATAYEHREAKARLKALLTRLSNIRIFDPACGSGNFLIIAYRELRKLEMRILRRLYKLTGHMAGVWSHIQLNNFYGIEYADFATETAKLSLWIAEYQMNELFKDEFGTAPPALPLKDGGNIVHANALRVDWQEVCKPEDRAETYIVGNPPYLGSSMQTKEQKNDICSVFSTLTKNYKNLDYVSAWMLKGAQYCNQQKSECAFVTTNSICQGDHVGLLWPLIYELDMEISFAHRSFKWANNAAKKAAVICIVVGIRRKNSSPKLIFDGAISRRVRNIGPYLLETDNTVVLKESSSISALPIMLKGNQPSDGGWLILNASEKHDLMASNPEAQNYLRRYYGSQEIFKGIERWCLWIEDANLG